jgi:hypothetical protein
MSLTSNERTTEKKVLTVLTNNVIDTEHEFQTQKLLNTHGFDLDLLEHKGDIRVGQVGNGS